MYIFFSFSLTLPLSCSFSPGSVPASVTKQQHLTSTRRQETGEAQISPAQHLIKARFELTEE